MALSLFQSPLYDPHFGDPVLADILSDAQDVARMVLFERALARVQGRLGVIPTEAGHGIWDGLAEFVLAPADLAEGVAASGVAVPALVSALRAALPEAHGQWLHWGATSQDVIDTAHVLGWKAALDELEPRLSRLIDSLSSAAEANAEVIMAARTRGQIATPITFGLRIAQWTQPLIALEAELPALRGAALRVQFGGASGANSAIAPNGPAITEALARDLGLVGTPPWHTDRGGVLRLADWLLRLSVALSKMSGDLILMMRSEISEARAGAGGGSSTMPQKSNPVGPETIRVLHRLIQAAHGGLVSVADHAEERDGAQWPADWGLLPQMLLGSGASLRHAHTLAETLQPRTGNMGATLAANSGVMAEQASFLLADHMPRVDAQALVKEAAKSGQPLVAALSELSDAPVNWSHALDPRTVIAPSRQVIDAILASRSGS